MSRYKYIRNVFYLTIVIIILPIIYNVLFVYPSFSRLLVTNSEENAIQNANQIITVFKLDSHFQLSRFSFDESFFKEIKQISTGLGAIKVNVYNDVGEVVFSTVENEVGTRNSHSYFNDIVVKGHSYTKLLKRGENEQFNKDVIQAYVPIIRGEYLTGALEIYYDITTIRNDLTRLVLISWGAFAILGSILVIVLFHELWKHSHQITLRHKAEQDLAEKKSQMEDDLDLAAAYQQAILPDIDSPEHIIISYVYIPFGKVSGDVYDISINKEIFDFFIGDATGHGVCAAFQAMIFHISMDFVGNDLSVVKTMEQLNSYLFNNKTGDKFLTGLFLRIPPDGLLRTAKAGHPTPLIITENSAEFILTEGGGPPLAAWDPSPIPFVEEIHQLENGNRVFVYTDGIIEHTSPDNELFGKEKLRDFLYDHRLEEGEVIISELLNHLRDFSGGKPIDDDVTIFCFKYVKP